MTRISESLLSFVNYALSISFTKSVLYIRVLITLPYTLTLLPKINIYNATYVIPITNLLIKTGKTIL